MRARRLPQTTALSLLAAPLLMIAGIACGGPDPNASGRAPLADKWLTRAKLAYRTGDLDDAITAIDGALKNAPKDPETRLLGARIALAKLDYSEAVKLTELKEGELADLGVVFTSPPQLHFWGYGTEALDPDGYTNHLWDEVTMNKAMQQAQNKRD